MVENVENRIRNTLGSIQTLRDISKMLMSNDSDSKNAVIAYDYLVKSNICDTVQAAIEKIILIAKACDQKIDDENFDVEKYITECLKKEENNTI